ncbi:methyltransferase [Candidatus Woesearchaeota archaeon]|nr:methyltransferase [Candidatus Woesearchaeota archaeon]
MKIKKILIDKKENKYYWKEGDFHSSLGKIGEKDIISGNIKSHLGKEFICFNASFADNVLNMGKGPAIMLPKDIGFIISYSGINEKSRIVEAGAGSGVLTAFLSNISHDVYSYEKNESNYNLARKNLDELGIKTNLKNKDITEGIDEKDIDLIMLDLPNPWEVLKHAEKSLKSGGFLISYLPAITQVQKLVDSKGDNFFFDKAIELIEREWYVEGQKVRPKSRMIGHTGFLVIFRKI